MKKNLSLAGFSLVAMGLFMGSCVSKKKYMDAQTRAAERYTTDSTEWATRTNTMQQNVSSLEQKNTAYQKQMDSFRTASETYQKRWDNLQSTYTQQNTSTEQLHQQIHTAIDQYVEASNVESRNGKVYINLPEKMLFTSSNSTTLSSKGKQALDKLADVLAANDNVEVDIVASAAYYSDGTTSAMSTTGRDDVNAATDKRINENAATDKPETDDKDVSDKPATANVGDSAHPQSGAVTKSKDPQDPAKKSTAKKATAKKNTATAKVTKQGDKSVSFKSSPKKSSKATATKAPSWNMNVARSTAIVRELTQNGLPQARIILTGQSGKGVTTNEWAATNRGYQIILSPKMDSYYQMMQEGQAQGTTSMK